MKMNRRKLLVPILMLVCILLTACQSRAPSASPTRISPTLTPQPTVIPELPSPAGRYFYAGSISGPYLDLLPNGSVYYSPKQFMLVRDEFVIAGDQITFSGEGCNGAKGTYQWKLQQETLKLSLVEDTCADRSKILTLTLKKVPQQFPYVNILWSKPTNQPDYNLSTVDAAGNFYINDGLSGTYKYDPDGQLVKSWNSLSYTTGITVDEQGHIYVSNFDDATIHKLDTEGKPMLSWKVAGGLIGPMALTHDPQGNIYVTLHRRHDHYVEKYSPDGNLLAGWVKFGPGDGENASGIIVSIASAIDAAGNIYLTDTANNRLVKYDNSGKFLYNITGEGVLKLFQPVSVAVDSQGNVYALSLLVIWKFDSSGKFLGEWFTPFFGNLVIDSNDNLFLIEQQIVKIELPAP
jgi:sugar lactone lactonase YvrE